MAGDEGLEPPNGGTRTHCLTTWRIPNDSFGLANNTTFRGKNKVFIYKGFYIILMLI